MQTVSGPGEFSVEYAKTIVIGDLHGDLHALLLSLAYRGLIHYEGDPDSIGALIVAHQGSEYCSALNEMVASQDIPVRLVFLGDLLDRYPFGYHILRFLQCVDWQAKNIELVTVMGNHDIHNLHFFTNPFMAHHIYSESDHSADARAAFICHMGLLDSLEGFRELHGAEIMALQRQFYEEGRLEWDLGYGKLTLNYDRDLSKLASYSGSDWKDVAVFCHQMSKHFGLSTNPQSDTPLEDFLEALGRYEGPLMEYNPFFLGLTGSCDATYGDGYEPRLLCYNLFYEGDGIEEVKGLIPVDWRLISLVWRKYYGSFYRRFNLVFLDDETLYVHGGLSPRTMIDSMGFGIIYRMAEQDFASQNEIGLPAKDLVHRINRLAGQIVENVLNDYSFKSLSGTEIFDVIGSCRGGERGFAQFGGFFWSDFNFLQMAVTRYDLIELYRRFVQATGIRRVICGHTRFEDPFDDDTRYLQLEELKKAGMDYICIDNSCSKGYRGRSLICGIEINERGVILDQGKFTTW